MQQESGVSSRTGSGLAGISLRADPLRLLLWADLWLPALFMILVLCGGPGITSGEHDNDEGFNLMKACLCLNGYELYTQIWSDQPPVLTFLLEQVFRMVGPSVEAGRALVLLLSALMVWTTYRLLKRLNGPLAGGIAVLLLVVSNRYVDLSVSVMVGLPSLALALLSLYWFVIYAQTRHERWLIASAVILAVSLHTKLFGLLLLPLFPLACAVVPQHKDIGDCIRSSARPLGKWLLILGMAWWLICWLFQVDVMGQLYQPHVEVSAQQRSWRLLHLKVQGMIIVHWGYVVLAICGVWSQWRRRQWHCLIPICWIILTLLAFSHHRPIHSHYVLLLTIPLSWLAALGGQFALTELRGPREQSGQRGRLALAGLSLVLLALGLVQGLRKFHWGLQESDSDENQTVVKLMSEAEPYSEWVLSDRPFQVFAAKLLVPPEVAVLSAKRWASKNMDSAQMLAILERYQPQQVLLGRFKYEAAVTSYLNSHYRTVFQGRRHRLYRLRASQAGEAEENAPSSVP